MTEKAIRDMSYLEQVAVIKNLTKRLTNKAANFAKQTKNPHFGDLGYVIDELQHVESFLSDKYLTK